MLTHFEYDHTSWSGSAFDAGHLRLFYSCSGFKVNTPVSRGPQGETMQWGLLCLLMNLLNVGISSEIEEPSKVLLIRSVHIEQRLIHAMPFKDFDTANFIFPPPVVNYRACFRECWRLAGTSAAKIEMFYIYRCFQEAKMWAPFLSMSWNAEQWWRTARPRGEWGRDRKRRRERGLIWRLHAAAISSTQNGQTHCWNMHESFPSGGWGVREQSRERSSLFIKLHETALRD